MRILCDEPVSEVGRGVRQEEVICQADTSRPQWTRNMHAKLQECVITSYDMVDDEGELVNYAFYANIELINIAEEIKDSRWVQAMKEELKYKEVNNTWSLVEFPQDKKTIDVKWIYKVKLNPKGEVTRHKARLVAKVFIRREGINFDDFFLPVARIEIIRLVIGLGNINN